jgi:hypothetical protein
MASHKQSTDVCHVKIRVVDQFITMSQTDITVVFFISNTATSRHVATFSTTVIRPYIRPQFLKTRRHWRFLGTATTPMHDENTEWVRQFHYVPSHVTLKCRKLHWCCKVVVCTCDPSSPNTQWERTSNRQASDRDDTRKTRKPEFKKNSMPRIESGTESRTVKIVTQRS